MRVAVAIFFLSALLSAARAQAGPDFVFDRDGRTVKAASHVSNVGRFFDKFTIAMPAPADVTMNCVGTTPTTFKPGALELYVQRFDEVQSPDVLPTTAQGRIEHKNGTFTVDPGGSGFLVYNVLQLKAADQSQIKTCLDAVQGRLERQKVLKGEVEALERSVTQKERAATLAREALKSRQQDAASFTGIAGAADQVARALDVVRKARDAAEAADTDLDHAREDLRVKVKERDEFPNTSRKELGVPLDGAAYLLDSLRAGAVLKIGGIFVGGHREAIFYDFAARKDNSTLQLSPIGDYPVVTHDERVFAVIANVNRAMHSYPFRLNATVSAGTPVNVEPVRPSFETTDLGTDPPKAPVSDQAYRDIFLSIRDSVPPNGNVEVTITTERPTAADPKKLETVTLVEKAKYPQFRARYRYNISTGVFRSKLRDQQFVKVRTVKDDPATEKVNEARYRIDPLEGDPQVKPVFSLSYYVFPVDIQSRVGWRDALVPAPTLAFGFVRPQDNVYLGLTHELWRNVQVFYGYHWGVKSEMVTRNEINEEEDASPPATRERRPGKEFAWGLSFNLTALAKVFK